MKMIWMGILSSVVIGFDFYIIINDRYCNVFFILRWRIDELLVTHRLFFASGLADLVWPNAADARTCLAAGHTHGSCDYCVNL